MRKFVDETVVTGPAVPKVDDLLSEVLKRCLFLVKSFFLPLSGVETDRGYTVREQCSAPLRDSQQLYYTVEGPD